MNDPRQMIGPYTRRSQEYEQQYRWKAENLIRWFRVLSLTEEEKVSILAKELAGALMYGEAHPRKITLDGD